MHGMIKVVISKSGGIPEVNRFIADMDDVFGDRMEGSGDMPIRDRDPEDIPLYGLDISGY